MKILLLSLSAFWKGKLPIDLTVILRPEELRKAHDALGLWPNIILRCIDENLIIPGITDHKRAGWWKQQVLKLAFSKISLTEFYLVLEPDVICCQAFDESDLFFAEKARTEWGLLGQTPRWYKDSADILKVWYDPENAAIGVTPQILNTVICHELYVELSRVEISKNPWLHLLDTETHWTEYTLYYLTGLRLKLLDKFHQVENSPPLHAQFLNNGGRPGDFPNWDPGNAFREGQSKLEGLFIVFQSSLNVAPEITWKRVSKYISPKLSSNEKYAKAQLELEDIAL